MDIRPNIEVFMKPDSLENHINISFAYDLYKHSQVSVVYE